MRADFFGCPSFLEFVVSLQVFECLVLVEFLFFADFSIVPSFSRSGFPLNLANVPFSRISGFPEQRGVVDSNWISEFRCQLEIRNVALRKDACRVFVIFWIAIRMLA